MKSADSGNKNFPLILYYTSILPQTQESVPYFPIMHKKLLSCIYIITYV